MVMGVGRNGRGLL